MEWYLRDTKKAKTSAAAQPVQELLKDVSAFSDYSDVPLKPGNWYHKPGPYDLTPEEHATLPATQQSEYKLVRSAADFGPEFESYCEGEEDEDDEDDSSEEDDDVAEDDGEPVLEECKMVLVVRQDLKMGKGKIGAQCGHATLGAYKGVLRKAHNGNKTMAKYLAAWEDLGQAKICVQVKTEEELDAVEQHAKTEGLPTHVVRDAGRTQIAAGSRTVLALGPAPKSKVDVVARHLKLM